MDKKFVIVLLIVGLFVSVTFAQPQEIIGEGLEGAELITFLQNNYQVTNSLGYGPARDVMYGEIDNVDLTLTCVYTGYTIPLNPSQGDPSQMAYDLDINCEHTWPQSLFDENEPMRSDMHHLFPTWVTANSARANYVFDEIPDDETDSWYYDAQVYQNPPPEDVRDQASELLSGTSFEPPEAHKGDIARAIFYFWSIYQTRSEVVDDEDFFEDMKDVLREWHYIDPADDWEINRSSAIGDEQGNRNPFVHDSTLVRRAYYPGSSSVQPEEMLAQEIVPVVAYPNPFNAGTNIQITLANSSDISLKVFNPLGQEVSEITNEQVAAGTQTFHFDGSCLPSGHYYLVVAVDGNSTVRKKLILLK